MPKIWFHYRRLKEQATVNQEKLNIAETIPERPEGPQIILAGHLNALLDMFTPAQILFVDLRSPSEFQRSHVHSAVNLRIPSSYLRIATLDLLDRTFPDEQSRRSFTRWSKTKCAVIYDRNIETIWECPTALELSALLRREGWPGNCFVLKGPFREFSMSFDKYITGDRMTKEAKKYSDGLRSATPPTEDQVRLNQARYEDWLKRVQHEGSTQTNHFSPREVGQKKASVDEHQRELEVEFEGRFPDLYRKMKDISLSIQASAHAPPAPPPKQGKGAYYDDDSYFDNRKAHLVGKLSTGLDKMREAAVPGPPIAGYSFPSERVPDKLGELPALDFDDFDEIDPHEAVQSPQSPGGAGRSAAAPPPASDASGGGGSGGSNGMNAPPISPLEYAARRLARENAAQKQGLWKRLKGNNGK